MRALGKTEELKQKTFKMKILRRIYSPYRDPKTGERRMRHNEELQRSFPEAMYYKRNHENKINVS